MARNFSLAFLTIPDIGPLEAVHVAADAGYQMIGLRLLPATAEETPYPLLDDRKLLHEVGRALHDRGMRVGDLEIIRLSPTTTTGTFLPFFDTAQFLNARHVIVVNDDPEEARAIETFSRLCEAAAPFSLTINLEPMPWTRTHNIAQAARIVDQANQANAGILIDALHFYRGGSRPEQLRALPARQINVFQICDAPALFDPDPAAIRHMARTARCIPGEGELDLKNLLTVIPPAAIVSIEIPNQQLIRTCPPLERAATALAATQLLYASQDLPQQVSPR